MASAMILLCLFFATTIPAYIVHDNFEFLSFATYSFMHKSMFFLNIHRLNF